MKIIENLQKEIELLRQVITHDMTDNCDLDNLIYFLEDNGIIKVINHGRLQDKIDEWTNIIEEV